MSSLTAILGAIKTQLDNAIGEGTAAGVQVIARRSFNPTPPSIDMYPADPFRETTLAGFGNISGGYLFTVRARVTTADYEAGQDVLLDLMDDESAHCVADILLDDQTLGGTVSSIDVEGPTGFSLYADPSGEGALLGVEWHLTVVNASTT